MSARVRSLPLCFVPETSHHPPLVTKNVTEEKCRDEPDDDDKEKERGRLTFSISRFLRPCRLGLCKRRLGTHDEFFPSRIRRLGAVRVRHAGQGVVVQVTVPETRGEGKVAQDLERLRRSQKKIQFAPTHTHTYNTASFQRKGWKEVCVCERLG